MKTIRLPIKKTNEQLSFLDYLKNQTIEVKNSHISSNKPKTHNNKKAYKVKSSDVLSMQFRRIHGGGIRKGKRKIQRPITPGKWMHVTLKSNVAKGAYSFLNVKHRYKIQNLIHSEARKNFITIGDGVNMGNHFHLKIKCRHRIGFQKFLRVITGRIARLVTGAQKGKPFGRKFWDMLAFSRVLTTSYEIFQLKAYFAANREERSHGYHARKSFLENFNTWKNSRSTNRSYS